MPGFKSLQFDLLDRWLPSSLKTAEITTLRRARFLLIAIIIVNLVGAFAGVAHLVDRDFLRAAFTTFSFIPNSLSIYLLYRSGRIEPSVHALCGSLAFIIVASPFLSEIRVPLYVGLFPLPFMAALVAGHRVGLVWTGLIVAILSSSAMWFPFDVAERFIAWNLAIVTAASGLAAAYSEFSRERIVGQLIEARESAERHLAERTRAELELRQSHAYFLESFRHAPSVLVLSDRKTGAVLDVNDRFTELLGYTRQEVIGKTSAEIGIWVNERDREEAVHDHVVGLTVRNRERPVRTRSGDVFWILLSVAPFEIEGRDCALVQAVDITARKRSDDEFEQARRELEIRFNERGRQLKASQAKSRENERLAAIGTLAAGMAHQINNPIGGIALAAEATLLESGDAISMEQRLGSAESALALALREARRCGRIVRSLLTFAREEETPQWVEDLCPVVARSAELARDYVEQLGGTLQIDIDLESLPVLMSPIDIEQAVVNLVRNAAESRPGGAHVRVETLRHEGSAEIRVTDNGAGIPLEDRSRILDPFYTTRLESGGTGLGLSVVHGVAAGHHGVLRVETPDEGGARLCLAIPISTDEPEEGGVGSK